MTLILSSPVCISEGNKSIILDWKIHEGLKLGVFEAGEGNSFGHCAFDVFNDVFGRSYVAIGGICLILGKH